MKTIKTICYPKKSREKGASLAIILLLVSFVLGALAFYYKSLDKQVFSDEAKVAAWEGAQIARAARLFVRNQIATVTDAQIAASGSANAQEHLARLSAASPRITIAQLINANLLPAGFLNTRIAAGGNVTNALGQTIQIIQQNFPIGGAPADPTTVPTAYVVFGENANINNVDEANLMGEVSQALLAEDIMVYAPLFNGNVNISNNCRGTPSIAFWDTNCLNNSDFNTLTGGNFVQGSLVIPAWRSVNFDTRALLRFPQPEQDGLNMMLTDLSMGNNLNCTVSVPINNPAEMGRINSANPICETNDDFVNPTNPALNLDNRRSILNPGSVEADNLILDPQASGDVYAFGGVNLARASENSNDVTIPGNLTIQNGEARIFNRGDFLNNITNNVTVASNVILPIGTTAQFGEVTADRVDITELDLENSEFTTNAPISANTVNIEGDINVSGETSPNVIDIPGTGNFVLETSNLSVRNFTANIDAIQVSGGGTGLGGYSLAVREFRTNNFQSTDNVTSNDISIRGKLDNSNTINVTDGFGGAECRGDCPLRTAAAVCNNLNSRGQLTTSGFTSLADCINNY